MFRLSLRCNHSCDGFDIGEDIPPHPLSRTHFMPGSIFLDPNGRECASNFVDPTKTRSREHYPYSYDPFYIWNNRGAEEAHGVYSDRLLEQNYDLYTRLMRKFGKRISEFSRLDASRFLSEYFGRPLKVVALAEGCNQSNGFPYWIFWYIDSGEQAV